MPISGADKANIRELANRVADVGHDPIQEVNRELWKKHNSLSRTRPMVLAFPEGAWCELLPTSKLRCEDPALRGWEWWLRHVIYRWDHIRDDNVIEPRIRVPATFRTTGWGVEPRHKASTVSRGAWGFDPVLKDPSDLKKLREPTFELDETATRRALDLAHELFDGILPVELYKKPLHLGEWDRMSGAVFTASAAAASDMGFDTSLINTLTEFCGLENIMLYLVDRPEFVHQAMSFMTDATLRMMNRMEKQGYVEPNNRDDYVGSGGVGYTDELPTAGSAEKGFTWMDCWGFANAQEFVLVSPQMHYEFVLQYQTKMLSRFGLTCYGCCESLTDKFDTVLKIPRLRRLSICPWADIRRSAEALQGKYIFSWKPNPADLAGDRFDGELIRSKIEDCVQVAKDCVLEIIMKDTHTLRHEPFRITEWVRIAKEIASQGYLS